MPLIFPSNPTVGQEYTADNGVKYVWNGYAWRFVVSPGISGFSGYSGMGASGYSGTSGAQGASGTSGQGGSQGDSGFSGTPGASGISGFSGWSGISGFSGWSGISGFSGWSGISGFSGWSGAAGSGGSSGFSGWSGASGQSGFSGYSGSKGEPGTGGQKHPDNLPAFPTSFDDEFNNSTLDSKWTITSYVGTLTTSINSGFLVATSSVVGGPHLVLQTIGDSTFKIRAKVAVQTSDISFDNYNQGGICLYHSATGKWLAFVKVHQTATKLELSKWTNGIFSSATQYTFAADSDDHLRSFHYLELEFNGTNIIGRFSNDGVYFSLVFTEALTTWFGSGNVPDKAGLDILASNATAGSDATLVADWIRKIPAGYDTTYGGSSGASGYSGAAGVIGVDGASGFSGYSGAGGSSAAINATNDISSTVLYPVMVAADGSNQTPKISTSKLSFNASTGTISAVTKSFLIDHPSKPDKKLRYGSLEGPENGVYVRGVLAGSNTISLPEYWVNLVDSNSITVSLTPVGYRQNLYVVEISNNEITIADDSLPNSDIHCFYTVWAERKDVEKLQVEVD